MIYAPTSSYNSDVSITSSSFTTVSSTDDGGLFYLGGQGSASLYFEAVNFTNFSSGGNGGAIYTQGEDFSLEFINNSSINSITSQLKGGFAYFSGSGIAYISLDSLSINSLSSSEGGFAFINGTNVTLQILNKTAISSSYSNKGGIFSVYSDDFSLSFIQSSLTNISVNGSSGGGFYIESINTAQIEIGAGSNFTQVSASDKGGLMFLESPTQTINIDSVTMNSISSSNQGGIFYSSWAYDVQFNIANLNVQTMSSTYEGSFYYVINEDSSSTYINLTIVNSSLACSSASMWSNNLTTYNSIISLLQNSTSNKGGMFYLGEGVYGDVLSDSNTFKQCYTTTEGSAFYLSPGTTFSDTSSIFKENAGIISQVYCDGCSATFTNSTFKDSLAANGSILYMKDDSTVVFDGVQMSSGKATKNAGAILAEGSGSSSLEFLNCPSTISYFQAANNGGFMKLDNPDLEFISSNCNWNHLYAGNQGGFIEGSQIASFSISNCSNLNISSVNSGSFFKAATISNDFTIQSCSFKCKNTYNSTQITSLLASGTSNIGSLFEINDAASVYSDSNTFENCYVANEGSIFNLKNTTFEDYNSVYNQNAALYGGVFKLTDTQAYLYNTSFSKSSSLQGGVFHIEGASSLLLEELNVTESTSNNDGGFIYAVESSQNLSIEIIGDVIYLNNMSSKNGNGGTLYLDGSQLTFKLTGQSALSQSSAFLKGGFAYIANSLEFLISQATFSQVQSKSSGSMIYSLARGSFDISESYFDCLGYNFQNDSSVYSKTSASIGGAFYFKDSNYVSVYSNTVQNCYTGDVGGAFYIENTSFSDYGSSTYSYNGALKGGGFYCKNCNVTFESTYFGDHFGQYGGLIYLEEATIISLDNVVIENTYSSINGGIVYSIANSNVTSSLIEFLNYASITNSSSANSGGAFYINNNALDILMNTPITITNSSALNGFGGVFYIQNANDVSIQDSNFIYFTSSTSGSFMYSISANLNLSITNNIFDSLTVPWDSSRDSINTSFYSQGGSFYIENATYTIQSQGNLFQNNYLADKGAAISIINANFYDVDSIYQYNRAIYGGSIYCSKCNFILEWIDISYTEAFNGGSIYVTNHVGTLSLSDSNITETKSYNQGGTIYGIGTAANSIQYSSIQVTNTSSELTGGFYYLNSSLTNLSFVELTLSNSQAVSSGGGFYFVRADTVTIEDSTLTDFYAEAQGSLMYSISTTLKLSISNNYMACISYGPWDYDTNILGKLDQAPIIYDRGGAFYISQAQSITSSLNTIENCYVCDQGGAYSLIQTVFTDTNSVYTSNSASMGGVFYIERSTVNLNELEVADSYADIGGVLYVIRASPLTVTNSIFTNNNAMTQGGFSQHTQALQPTATYTANFSYCIFENTQSGVNGGAFYIDQSQLTGMTFHQVEFTNTSAPTSGGIFYINSIGGKITITSDTSASQKSTFSQFQAGSYGSFLYSLVPAFSLNISDSIFECYTSYDQTNVENDITQTTASFAGAFFISNSISGVNSQNNVYRNCYTASTGGIYTLTKTILTDTNSNFYQNAALGGGVIKCDSCSLTFLNSEFTDNAAGDGGVFLFDNQASMIGDNIRIQNNFAANKGGALSIVKSSLNALAFTYILIKNSNNINDNYADIGGLINIENKYISVILNNTEISSISSDTQGGVINVVDADKIMIIDSYIHSFSSPDGLFMISISSNLYLDIYKTDFECNSTLNEDDIQSLLDQVEPEAMSTTTFQISNAKNISITSSSFQSCGVSEQGGVFNLLNTHMYDFKSTFQNNAGAQGGVINCQFTDLYFSQSIFQNNYGSTGGVISLQSYSFVDLKRVLFTQNQAYSSGGCLYVSTESYFNATNTNFIENKATETSTIEVLGSSSTYNISIESCNFESNIAVKNTISLMYANVIIKESQLQYNEASQRTKNIFCGFSSILVYKTYFKSYSYKNPEERVKNELTSGTFFFVIFDVNLQIWNSQFLNGLASIGGAIYISGDSSIQIYSSTFYNNYAKTYGGAIYGSGFSKLYIAEGSQFKNNLALENGDDFYVTNTEYKFTLDLVNITNPQAKTSIYAELVSLQISRSAFMEMYNNESSSGAAINCINCRSIKITNTLFANLSSQLGGAIYLEENENNKKSTDKYGKYKITNSKFINCSATTGGAINAINPQYLTLDSSLFLMNEAFYNLEAVSLQVSGAGGSLYYSCDDINLNCDVDIINKNNFTGNYAAIKGGAIYWDVLEPKFDENTGDIIFQNNSAKQYGDNIGCFAQTLGILNSTYYKQKMIELGLLDPEEGLRRMLGDGKLDQATASISSQRSGGEIPKTYLAHIDKYGQIVGSDFSSTVRVQINATSNSNPSAFVYPPIIEGTTQFQAQGGMVEIKDLIFAGTPGYSYSVSFSTDGIDLSKKSNQDYMALLGKGANLDFDLKITLRDCEIGEQFTSAGKCLTCPDGTSYSLVKMTSPGTCQECPSEKAVCYGGSNVGPKAGYWRKNNHTSTFIKCLYEAACIGMVPPENNPQGSCYDGYEGILCASCQVGFSRSGEYECSYCPEPVVNIVRLSFIFIGVILLLVFMIRSTLNGAKEKNNVTSIFFKIMLNHMQLILLTASFNFDWPKLVMQLFDTAKPVASVSTQIISFDCFLDTRKSKDTSDGEGIRIFFQKLIMLSILPFLLAVSSFLIWQIIKLFKKSSSLNVQSRSMSTMVIVLFLVHPSIVQFMFYDFKCMNIDGEERIQDDLQVLCWNDEHKVFSYFIALPSIIVWGLGIPFFAFILLSKVKKDLDKIETREKYGFLYRGYRKDFYYWEIVIMYRKILLIFISVFIISFGVIAQALIVFMVLIVFMIINSKKKPFSTIALNDLETLSLVTSMITVYCGLYFITDKPEKWIAENPDYSSGSVSLSEDAKLLFFGIICFANLIFLVYWLYKMYQEVKAKFREKLPKLYLAVCLCFNHQKLQKELIAHQVQLENENLKEEFFKRLKEIKKIYYNGSLVLTDNSIERLLNYLTLQKVIDIAGQQEKPDPEQMQKQSKRYLRIRQAQENNKSIFAKSDDLGIMQSSDKKKKNKANYDEVVKMQPLNNDYYAFEDFAKDGYRKGKIQAPITKDFLEIDQAFFEDSLQDKQTDSQKHSRSQSNQSLIMSNENNKITNLKAYTSQVRQVRDTLLPVTNSSLLNPDSTRSLNSQRGFLRQDRNKKFIDSLNFTENLEESNEFYLSEPEEEFKEDEILKIGLKNIYNAKSRQNDSLFEVIKRGNNKKNIQAEIKQKHKKMMQERQKSQLNSKIKDALLRQDSKDRELDIDLEVVDFDSEDEAEEGDFQKATIKIQQKKSNLPQSTRKSTKLTIKHILEREHLKQLGEKLGTVEEFSEESPRKSPTLRVPESVRQIAKGLMPVFVDQNESRLQNKKFSSQALKQDIILEDDSESHTSSFDINAIEKEMFSPKHQGDPQQEENFFNIREGIHETENPAMQQSSYPLKINFMNTDDDQQ